MSKHEAIDQALLKTKQHIERSPADPLLKIIESQLKYVRKILNGKRLNRYRLSRINIGAFGADKFSDDPVYVNLLVKSQQVADQHWD